MIQLKVLSGTKAGASVVARRFPFRVGRSPKANLQLDDPGVWDEHLRIAFVRAEGYVLKTEKNALITLNGQSVDSGILRNGDVIGLGSAKVQFWLAETGQVALGAREVLTWVTIAAVCLGQVALVYLLLRI